MFGQEEKVITESEFREWQNRMAELEAKNAKLKAELESLYKIMKEQGMLEVAEEMLRRERETALPNFKAKSREEKMFKS